MHFNFAAAAFLLPAFVAAAPRPQDDPPKAPFGISFTYENGTGTPIFPVPDSLDVVPLDSIDPVAFSFFSPPAGKTGHCVLLEPNRQGLGSVQVVHAINLPVTPPTRIGFAQCNSDS